ncbi:MAG: hypothetical protein IJE84_03415, partial [Clostridia bacterium]|nr:hypothetical protein [Clostridia bacterium]
NYVDRGSAMWRSEVSPSELSSYVRTLKGCSNITSPIDSVIIESTAGESGYVKSITFVDTAGNKATVGNTTAKVKSALYDYVKSANFVVGKDSVDFKYNIIKTVTVSTGKEPEPFYEQNPGYFDKFLISDYKVKTSAQKLMSAGGNFLAMLTHVGRQSVTVDRANVLTADGYKRLYELGIDIDNIYKNVSDAAPQLLEAETSNTSSTAVGEEAVSVDLLEVTETIKASKEGYFVFAGKGWGHGVGMSQYGVLDLANAGMSGEGILKTYFKGVTISTY